MKVGLQFSIFTRPPENVLYLCEFFTKIMNDLKDMELTHYFHKETLNGLKIRSMHEVNMMLLDRKYKGVKFRHNLK